MKVVWGVVACLVAVAFLLATGVWLMFIGTGDTGTGGGTIFPEDKCATGTGVEGGAAVAPAVSGPADDGPLLAAKAALAAGFNEAEAVVAVAIAGCESTWNPTIRNTQGSSASGMWQTLRSHYEGTDLVWSNPYDNAKVAYRLFKGSGWASQWVCYANGKYKKHLVKARIAVAEALETKGVPPAQAATTQPVADKPTGDPSWDNLRPIAKQAGNYVKANFGQTIPIGGWAGGTGHMSNSKHYSGLALDVMTYDNKTLGWRIAKFFADPTNAARFGVENVIFDRAITNAGRGWKWVPGSYGDRGNPTLNHEDHPHIDFHADAKVGRVGNVALPVADLADPAVECVPVSQTLLTSGPISYPLARKLALAHDSKNFGNSGDNWESTHQGTDFSVPCGTPVLAATSGTFETDATQLWAGPNFAKIVTGPKKLATWYGHMQKLTVRDGAQVKVGDIIGEVGTLGNSTGCHLHFEVHPRNQGYGEDPVDPTPWLASHVGKKTQIVTAVKGGVLPDPAPGKGLFTVASFNVLGSNHTGGNGAARMPGAIKVIQSHGVDMGGFQELQPTQHKAFVRLAGGSFGVATAKARTDNAVFWRRSVFRWVKTYEIEFPYFEGDRFGQPVVLLELRANPRKKFLVGSFHNPAETAQHRNQSRWRLQATQAQIRLAQRAKYPLIITGDMNERDIYYDRLTAATDMHSPGRDWIDWIFASSDLRLSGYRIDHASKRVSRSDHPIVTAEVS